MHVMDQLHGTSYGYSPQHVLCLAGGNLQYLLDECGHLFKADDHCYQQLKCTHLPILSEMVFEAGDAGHIALYGWALHRSTIPVASIA